MKTGVFTGSFDPFTVGHDDIVRRALPLFDKIVIGVGVNERKQYLQSADERVAAIAALYEDDRRIEVKAYSDLTVDFARREGARFIVKGVRGMRDFEYEREQASVNRRIGDVETVMIFADPRYESVSSSMVRELLHFGRSVDEFLPKAKTAASCQKSCNDGE